MRDFVLWVQHNLDGIVPDALALITVVLIWRINQVVSAICMLLAFWTAVRSSDPKLRNRALEVALDGLTRSHSRRQSR